MIEIKDNSRPTVTFIISGRATKESKKTGDASTFTVFYEDLYGLYCKVKDFLEPLQDTSLTAENGFKIRIKLTNDSKNQGELFVYKLNSVFSRLELRDKLIEAIKSGEIQ